MYPEESDVTKEHQRLVDNALTFLDDHRHAFSDHLDAIISYDRESVERLAAALAGEGMTNAGRDRLIVGCARVTSTLARWKVTRDLFRIAHELLTAEAAECTSEPKP